MSVPVTMPNSRPGRVHLFVCSLTRGWVDVMHHSLAVISRPQFSFGGGWACARLSGEITRDSVSPGFFKQARPELRCRDGGQNMAALWSVEAVRQAVNDRAIKPPRRLMFGWPTISRPRGSMETKNVVQNKRRLGSTKSSDWLTVFPASQLHLFTPPSSPPPPTTTPTFGNSGCWQSPSRLPLAAMQPRRNLKHCLDGLPEHWDSRHCQLAILLLFPLQSGPKHQAGSWGWV